MTKYLFLFTISPVQSFISQARKTHDLWAGSTILAILCKTAIQTAKELGINVVFPYIVEGVDSIPNRFIGTIESPDDTQFVNIGKKIEEKVQEKFREIAKASLIKIEKPKYFNEQIDSHLEIYWLFNQCETNYSESYLEIERLLGGLKNTRIFKQLPEQGRKCSLDGERNALFFGGDSNPKYIEDNKAIELDSDEALLNPNEGLSAVSFMKRNYQPEGSKRYKFDSTAKIALMNYLEKIDKRKIDEYKTIFNGTKHFDEQLCYAENLNQSYFKKQGLKKEIYNLEHIQKLHKEIFGHKELPKYYALVIFDGDRMGKLLSGEFINVDKRKDELEKFQTKLSELLGNYAKQVIKYLQAPKGKYVYAGGDDFLGFVNLDHLFDVLDWLRSTFETDVNLKLKNEFQTILDSKFDFTFSAGVVIAHYKMPLHYVLQKVRSAEKKAKDEGRNRLCINVLKHSGEAHEAVVKWNLYKSESQSIHNIRQIVASMQNKGREAAPFSETYIRKFESEILKLTNNGKLKNEDNLKLLSIAEAEIHRLMMRSSSPSQSKEVRKQKSEELKNNILYFFEREKKGILEEADINNLLQLMKICLFLNNKIKKYESS